MKALIPAAGHGTRFAPFTKLVPKEMLPIGARPAIALIVDEAIEAGADEVVIITSPEKPLLKKWFEIEPPKVKITWIDQLEQHGLGHAVLQAANLFCEKDDKVLILLGDALVSGGCASKAMVERSEALGGVAVIGVEEVPLEKVSLYGIMKVEDDYIVDMVEKPSVDEAPSRLAVAGRYLLPVKIFEYLKTQTPGKGGEIQLTDSIKRMIADGTKLAPYVYHGKRQDIGNPAGYYETLAAFRELEF